MNDYQLLDYDRLLVISFQPTKQTLITLNERVIEMGDELANGYIKILTLFMEKYDRDDHELYGIQEKLFKHIL